MTQDKKKKIKSGRIRGPSNPLRGHVDGQLRSDVKSYTRVQQRLYQQLLEEERKKTAKKSQEPVLDFGAHYDAQYDYTDDWDDHDFTSRSANAERTEVIEPSQAHHEEDEGDWEDIEQEARLFYEAKKQYQHSFRKDYRKRRDKIEVDQQRWRVQIDGMAQAFMDYKYREREGREFDGEVLGFSLTKVVDIFYGTQYMNLAAYRSDEYISASLVRQGYFPCNPLIHKSVISTRTLELYHHLFVRCPRLSIQPFIRSLCDMEGVRFKNYLCVQFSSAYDAFIAVKNNIRSRIRQVLGRGDSDWRSLNACPCCQYEVVGEPELEFGMLAAMDGNDSLKRLERRDPAWDSGIEGELRERSDPRTGGGDYFLSPDEVDQWDPKNWPNLEGYSEPSEAEKKREKGERNNSKGCDDRWDNMKKSHTDIEQGMFKETGVFVSACRHMFVLWIIDMIKSGEQRKYALAFLHRFLTAIREDRARRSAPQSKSKKGFGYDIGCQFHSTVEKSPLKTLADDENVKILIGSLHGHAHNRRCQLGFLLTYIYGAGLEDLEVMERLFSQSNALAAATRHASSFHRRQMIALWMYHHDNYEAYGNITKFIYNNYAQALAIVSTKDSVLERMKEIKITDAEEMFRWLDEEREYLESRQEETREEDLNTIHLYRRLVQLQECRVRLESTRNLFQTYDPSQRDQTYALERTMRHHLETEEKILNDIHLLEDRMNIKERWTEGSMEWIKAEELSRTHHYQKCVDRLEGLVVARIFELSKMHMAGTGYKMRRHLGKALKSRSKTIQEAVSQYNAAAAKLSPPRPALDYEDVVEKAYLSELDFLKDTRSDVREKAWAVPANRVLMNEYFKIFRAWEELDRLHVEIRRLVTYMKEENAYLKTVEAAVAETDPALAYQISLYRWERGRFNSLHRMRLRKIYKLPGFNPRNLAWFTPGVGVRRQTIPSGEHEQEDRDDNFLNDEERREAESANDGGEEGEEGWESEGEEEEEEAADTTASVLRVAIDS